MRKIKYVFALLAALLALTTAALAAEPGDALVPVGEAVAISLRCDGVVVSALADIASEGGTCCPAGEAGVQAGDKIVAVNGERVTGAEDFLRRAAAFSGEGVTLSVERGGETKTFAVTPKLGSGGTYQIGLWLRDAVRGLGTVTFYDPATGEHGALGHGVGLPETGELMSASGGEIYRADVTGVVMGERGARESCAAARAATRRSARSRRTRSAAFSARAGRRSARFRPCRSPRRARSVSARRRSSPPSVPAAYGRMTP